MDLLVTEMRNMRDEKTKSRKTIQLVKYQNVPKRKIIGMGWPCLAGWGKSHTKCPDQKSNKKATKGKTSPTMR